MDGLKINVVTIDQKTLTSNTFQQLPELGIDGLGVVVIGGRKAGWLSQWVARLNTETREGRIADLTDLSCEKADDGCFSVGDEPCTEQSLACPLWTEDRLVLRLLGYALVKNKAVFLVADDMYGPLFKISVDALARILAAGKIHIAIVTEVDPDDCHAGTPIGECPTIAAVMARSPQIFLGSYRVKEGDQ